MDRKQNPNEHILLMCLQQLGPVADEMVFLGGCATGILLTDDAAAPVRATRDVWYKPALEHHEIHELRKGYRLKLVSPPYFLATKIAAFEGRGQGDFMASHDLEDIVAVIDGRPKIIQDVANSNRRLKKYLAEIIGGYLENNRFIEAVSGHLPPDEASQARSTFVVGRLQAIVDGN